MGIDTQLTENLQHVSSLWAVRTLGVDDVSDLHFLFN